MNAIVIFQLKFTQSFNSTIIISSSHAFINLIKSSMLSKLSNGSLLDTLVVPANSIITRGNIANLVFETLKIYLENNSTIDFSETNLSTTATSLTMSEPNNTQPSIKTEEILSTHQSAETETTFEIFSTDDDSTSKSFYIEDSSISQEIFKTDGDFTAESFNNEEIFNTKESFKKESNDNNLSKLSLFKY